MKEIVLAVIIIGMIGTTVGFAQNTVSLTLQDLGLGEDLLLSPISAADVTLKTKFVFIPSSSGVPGMYKKIISDCLFRSTESIPGSATIICKLIDGSNGPKKLGKVVAEGKINLQSGYMAGKTITIPITQTAFPLANAAQTIQAAKLVVSGPDINQGGGSSQREISLKVTKV